MLRILMCCDHVGCTESFEVKGGISICDSRLIEMPKGWEARGDVVLCNKHSPIGKTVVVYDRYLFALPVRGRIEKISSNDGAYRVNLVEFKDNHAYQNSVKHSGTYFFKEQCRIIEESNE